MKAILILMAIALVGCKDEPTVLTIPDNQITYRVTTNVNVEIVGIGIQDTMTRSNHTKTFLYNGSTLGSPDLYLQANRMYNANVDSIFSLDNNKTGIITTEILVKNIVVAAKTIVTPPYFDANGIYYTVGCGYDM